MEEKKINELNDEKLAEVAGGGDTPYKPIKLCCPSCLKGTVTIPRYGCGTGECTDCRTTFRSLDGKLLF